MYAYKVPSNEQAALRLENHAFESALGPVSPSLAHLTEPPQSTMGAGEPDYAASVNRVL